ncbi:unnamed protein product [Rotaria sordida]|uniref:Uncharacterized protein n=1 Tax=Rotaria sordida TaxID=392033 RepID=A0A815J2X9_9BILA|nr:unnamed protein product [Rotaria sordida]CAF1612863.1 unnamed protein product [Rotaria sordida]
MNIQKLETLSSEKLPQESYCEILGAAICLDYYAGWADKITGETLSSESGIFITYIKHESVGIYEQIILWYISILVELTRLEGTKHDNLISLQMLDVAVRVESIRSFACNQMIEICQK